MTANDTLWIESKQVAERFLLVNKLTPCRMQEWNGQSRSGWFGYYRNGTAQLSVNVKRCSDDFVGEISDNSVAGVLAHELGHHVDHVLYCRAIFVGLKQADWCHICEAEPSIGSYDLNNTLSEKFAEAMRLFILNPDLLLIGRPMRYRFLAEDLRLEPVELRPWQQVLDKMLTRTRIEGWIH